MDFSIWSKWYICTGGHCFFNLSWWLWSLKPWTRFTTGAVFLYWEKVVCSMSPFEPLLRWFTTVDDIFLHFQLLLVQRARLFWFFSGWVFEVSPSPIVLSNSLSSLLFDKTTSYIPSYQCRTFFQSKARIVTILEALNSTLLTFTSRLRSTHFFATVVISSLVAWPNLSRYYM